MKNEATKNFSLLVIVIAFLATLYGTYEAIKIVGKTQIGTSEGIYTNRVTNSKEIAEMALELTMECKNDTCKAQKVLDYVTHIPYKINHFQAHSPQRTIQNNFGDCDDKSNLLISMLHVLHIESYFVLVPEHIFVIAHIADKRLASKKGIWLNEKKYFLLESTAKGSKIGFPLRNKLEEIDAVIEPFSNKKIEIKQIAYKL